MILKSTIFSICCHDALGLQKYRLWVGRMRSLSSMNFLRLTLMYKTAIFREFRWQRLHGSRLISRCWLGFLHRTLASSSGTLIQILDPRNLRSIALWYRTPDPLGRVNVFGSINEKSIVSYCNLRCLVCWIVFKHQVHRSEISCWGSFEFHIGLSVDSCFGLISEIPIPNSVIKFVGS